MDRRRRIAGRQTDACRDSAPALQWLAWALLSLATLALVASPSSYLRRTPASPIVRFTLPAPEGVTFAPAGAPVAPFPAISPDGTRLAFIANREGESPSVWVRSLDSLDSRPLNDTTVRTDTLSPALPFWSPDSRSIGFFADGKLKRVDVNGGSPQTICDAAQSGGGSWGVDGTIVFASRIDEGLRKVPAGGGVSVQVTKPDAARGEIPIPIPRFFRTAAIFCSGSRRPGRRFASARSIRPRPTSSSSPIHGRRMREAMFFVRQSTLFAQPFDTGLSGPTAIRCRSAKGSERSLEWAAPPSRRRQASSCIAAAL